METLRSIINELRAKDRARPRTDAESLGGTGDLPTGLRDALQKMDLLAPSDRPPYAALGKSARAVSYRVELAWGTVYVKCARPPAAAKAAGAVPGARSELECEWLKIARSVLGEAVPEVLGSQPGIFAAEYLAPERHDDWAKLLHDGEVNPSAAAEVGRLIGRVHAATANNFAIAQRFTDTRAFGEARVEPLVRAAAQSEPLLSAQLRQLALAAERNKLVLIHGDFIPANLLIGPKGPVLANAECACYGDPVIDLALCLSELLTYCVLRPQSRDRYLTCYDAMRAAYVQRITWEMPELTEERAALMLPALMLAGALEAAPAGQPAQENERSHIQNFARTLLLEPVLRLSAVREAWRRSFLS